MTVGERIQFYRKQIGLSQEDLGQKLLVSRQTVSLWENDQTVPTIDNLLRLREIFGVSVDELLGAELPNKSVEEIPNESYSYKYTQMTVSTLKKYYSSLLLGKYRVGLAIGVIITVFSFISALFSKSEQTVSISENELTLNYTGFCAFLTIIVLIVYLITRSRFKKMWKSTEPNMLDTIYEYKFFGKYVIINLYRNSEAVNTSKIYYDKIAMVHDLGELQLIETGRELYPLSKTDFQRSEFFNHFASIGGPEKHINAVRAKKWKTASVAFVVLSVLSLVLAPGIGGALSELNSINEAEWFSFTKYFFMLIPIPLSSVVFGIIACRKGFKAKKNIIVGIIFAVLLGIYGCLGLLGNAVFNSDETPIIDFEEQTGYDLPDYVSILGSNTNDLENEDPNALEGKEAQIGSFCEFVVEKETADEFYETISQDSNWLRHIDAELDEICFREILTQQVEQGYYLIYNTDTGEFNTLPSQNGQYNFYNVGVDTSRNIIILIEYYVDYSVTR